VEPGLYVARGSHPQLAVGNLMRRRVAAVFTAGANVALTDWPFCCGAGDENRTRIASLEGRCRRACTRAFSHLAALMADP